MQFSITYSNGLEEDFEGDAKFVIQENGILVVTEDGVKSHLSPTAWHRVKDETPRKAPRIVGP